MPGEVTAAADVAAAIRISSSGSSRRPKFHSKLGVCVWWWRKCFDTLRDRGATNANRLVRSTRARPHPQPRPRGPGQKAKELNHFSPPSTTCTTSTLEVYLFISCAFACFLPSFFHPVPSSASTVDTLSTVDRPSPSGICGQFVAWPGLTAA